jgi:hypothetical protein
MDVERIMNSSEPKGYVDDLRDYGFAEALLGTQDGCSDQVVGQILSGWRYDLSGVSPEVRGAYVEHFAECRHCRARQRVHRTIDVVLLTLQTAAIGGLLLSVLMWVLVAIATPAPGLISHTVQQRRLQGRERAI